MKIIEPSCELWQQTDPIAHVARCARVCYGNAVSKGEEADKRLYESLKKSGHLSMFRHESVYAIIPQNKSSFPLKIFFDYFLWCPYIKMVLHDDTLYVATNGNFMLDHPDNTYFGELLRNHQVASEYFANTEIGRQLMRYTFHITTQISTSRELNRVSPNNIAERSTRYVYEDGIICRPHWMLEAQAAAYKQGISYVGDSKTREYLLSCERSFDSYKALIEQDIKRQDARGVLPLDTATEVVYTYSIDEWQHIIELRSDKRAHPNARIIANMVKSKLEELGYDFV